MIKTIITSLTLYSLIMTQTLFPLNYLLASDDPPSVSTDKSWDREQKVEVTTDSPTAAPKDNQEESVAGKKKSKQEDASVSEFNNDGVAWATVILSNLVHIGLGIAVMSLVALCPVKGMLIPSIAIITSAFIAWVVAEIAFKIAYQKISQDLADEFVYNRADDKDRQLTAAKTMRDNTQELYELLEAQKIVYAVLVAAIEAAVAATIVEQIALHFAVANEVASRLALTTSIATADASASTLVSLCTTLPIMTAIILNANISATTIMPPAPPLNSIVDAGHVTASKTRLAFMITKATLIPGAVGTDTGVLPPRCPQATGAAKSIPPLIADATKLVEAETTLATTRTWTILECPIKAASNITPTSSNYASNSCDSFPIDSLLSLFIPKAKAEDPNNSMMVGGLSFIIDTAAVIAVVQLVKHFRAQIGTVWLHPTTRIIAFQVIAAMAIAMEILIAQTADKVKQRVEAFDDIIAKIEADLQSEQGSTSPPATPFATSPNPQLTDINSDLTQGTPVPMPTISTSTGDRSNPNDLDNDGIDDSNIIMINGTPTYSDIYGTPSTNGTPNTNGTPSTSGTPNTNNNQNDSGNGPTPPLNYTPPSDYNFHDNDDDSTNLSNEESSENLDLDSLQNRGCTAQSPSHAGGQVDPNCNCLKDNSCKRVSTDTNQTNFKNLGPGQNDYATVQKGLGSIADNFAKGKGKEAIKAATDSSFRGALKRLMNAKKNMLDDYNKSREKDKKLPSIAYNPEDPLVKKMISDIKQAAGNQFGKGSDSLMPSSAMSESTLSSLLGKDSSAEKSDKDSGTEEMTTGTDHASIQPMAQKKSDDPLKDFLNNSFQGPLTKEKLKQERANSRVSLESNTSSVHPSANLSIFKVISLRYIKSGIKRLSITKENK